MSLLFRALPFAFLWFILINQLRVEWTVNPQYNYGWAVPFLCAYLAYRAGVQSPRSNVQSATEDTSPRPSPQSGEGGKVGRLGSGFHLPSAVFYLLFAFVALLYSATRLVQEANPEWRLVSWALALEVVGITLLFLGGVQSPKSKVQSPTLNAQPSTPNIQPEKSPSPLRGEGRGEVSGISESPTLNLQPSTFNPLTFSLLFFLVAVPWPTFIEQPVVELLTRGNVSMVIELLNATGIPALQQGNVIQISSGLIGIDDACSGIRSFQASLMLSLFLGAFYRVTAYRQVGLCFAGFGLAFLFNIARTFLLTWVASRDGLAAMARWHDPAGVGVLVACFMGVWALALVLRRRSADSPVRAITNRNADFSRQEANSVEPKPTEIGAPAAGKTQCPTLGCTPHPVPLPFEGRGRRSWACIPSALLLGWLLLTEGGVEAWYRVHEANLPKAVVWTAHWPVDKAGFKELPLAETARQLLRYDEASNVSWREEDGTRWQVIYLRWKPGRVAVHLAKSHTPDVCLSAAGKKLEGISDIKSVPVHGLRLPFRSYQFQEENRPVYVFYCLWEDRAEEQGFRTEMLTYENRFAPVRAGRRNLGQRVLEVAVQGVPDLPAAETALQRQLEKVIRR